MTLDESFFSCLFPHLQNGNNNSSYLTRLPSSLNKTIWVEHGEECLAYGRYSVSGSPCSSGWSPASLLIPGQEILMHTIWLPGFKQLARGSRVSQTSCAPSPRGEETCSPEGVGSGPAEATQQAEPSWAPLSPQLRSAVPSTGLELREPPASVQTEMQMQACMQP